MSTTGEAVFDSNGNWKNKERVVSDKIIGAHVDNENGKETRTKAAVIVYSKEDEEESIIIRNENNVLIEIAKHEITEIEML